MLLLLIVKTDHLKESYDRYKDLSELTKKSENTRNSVEENHFRKRQHHNLFRISLFS